MFIRRRGIAEVANQPGAFDDSAACIVSGVPNVIDPEGMPGDCVLAVFRHRLVFKLSEVNVAHVDPAARLKADSS